MSGGPVRRRPAATAMLAAALCAAGVAAAAAPARLAVVIGNQDYETVTDLSNARSDAERFGAFLRLKGFTVFDGYDLDREGFERLMRSAILNADDGSEIVFFYAGHGIQIGRRNYLLPADVAFDSVYDLPVESITLDRVIDVLSAKGTVHLSIIDACRENPFPDLKLAGDLDASLFETRSGFDVFRTPLNSLVAFSTSPGMLAYDGPEGGNSPYTSAILEIASAEPSADVTALFSRVREDVYTATDGLQVPWESSTLVRPFRFAPAQPEPADVQVASAADGATRAVGEAAVPESPAALPEAITLTVPFDREIPLDGALSRALGLDALPAFTVASPAQSGQVDPAASGGLTYEPTLIERRAEGEAMTLADSFTLATAAGDRLSVTLDMPVNACDVAAGDALDPGGVGVYRLPNEIPVETALQACEAAVEAAPDMARFRYQLGRAQQAAADFDAAFASFTSAAEAGHIRALNATARLLTAPQVNREAFDVPEDKSLAMALLEDAAGTADPFAMHLLGRFLLRDGESEAERERGFELLERAAELGHTYSMNELGIYFMTEGNPHYLPERGLRYLQASAERQDIYGYHNLGFVELVGLMGEPDYEAARGWFEQAAAGGHPRSPATLGRMIVRGQIDGTPAQAVAWYDQGLARGDAWGGVNAANMILNGEVSGFTPAEALVRSAKAAQLPDGDAAAQARDQIAGADEADLGRAIQLLLNELGAGLAVDGLVGPATRAEIERRAAAAGIAPPAGGLDQQLLGLGRIHWAENPIRSDVF